MERKEVINVQQLRRITGYLVADIKYWNEGKKAELKDRTTHAGCEVPAEWLSKEFVGGVSK
jgi:hypothetical protein